MLADTLTQSWRLWSSEFIERRELHIIFVGSDLLSKPKNEIHKKRNTHNPHEKIAPHFAISFACYVFQFIHC